MFIVAGYETDLGDKVGGGTCKLRRAWRGTETIKTEKHRKRVYLGANLPEAGDGWEDMDFKEKGKCVNSHHDKNLNYFNREVGLGSQVLKVSAHTHLVLRPLCHSKAALPSSVMEEDAGLMLGIYTPLEGVPSRP